VFAYTSASTFWSWLQINLLELQLAEVPAVQEKSLRWQRTGRLQDSIEARGGSLKYPPEGPLDKCKHQAETSLGRARTVKDSSLKNVMRGPADKSSQTGPCNAKRA